MTVIKSFGQLGREIAETEKGWTARDNAIEAERRGRLMAMRQLAGLLHRFERFGNSECGHLTEAEANRFHHVTEKLRELVHILRGEANG